MALQQREDNGFRAALEAAIEASWDAPDTVRLWPNAGPITKRVYAAMLRGTPCFVAAVEAVWEAAAKYQQQPVS